VAEWGLVLHHDNTPTHTAQSVQQFIAKKKNGGSAPTHPTSLLVTFSFVPTEAGFESEAFC